MLRDAKSLEGFKLGALDGQIGRVKEFYFDDQTWTARYLVADTGSWLPERQVLISPFALGQVDENQKILHVNLTRQRVEACPGIEMDKPISRQYEWEYYRYYGWPMYWYGPALWGPAPFPVYGHGGVPADPVPPRTELEADPHLRSTREVRGYHIHALDGEIGHVEDFLIDDEDWAIRYLVVGTRNWWPGRKVLVSPAWIENVSWDESTVKVDLHRETIKNAPEFSPGLPVTRDFEQKLFDYYKRDVYWHDAAAVRH